jgi:diguanylate cyclase (GGDEF)-like protein
MAHDLNHVRGLPVVGRIMLAHIVQSVPARFASLAVQSEDGNLVVVATHGYSAATVAAVRIVPGTGIIGEAFHKATPLLIEDVQARRPGQPRRVRFRTNSAIAVPITSGGQVLGVVSLTDRTGKLPFRQADVDVLQVLAVPAGLALAREYAEREAAMSAKAAIIDSGTGLFNRPYFQTRLEEELQRATRQHSPASLMLLDIDSFKAVNDTFGHLAGDAVIRDVADILRRSVRAFDVCARYGGEEFAVVMPGSDLHGAAAIAERVRARVEASRSSEPLLRDVAVTASLGVCELQAGATTSQAIEQADRALYAAKRGGKNRVSTTP